MAAAVALALVAGTPAVAEQSNVDALRETRLGSSPSVEPLDRSRRTPLPLLRQDQQRLRRTEPALRCSYLRGRRVCR
jgi:hypothetical protein